MLGLRCSVSGLEFGGCGLKLRRGFPYALDGGLLSHVVNLLLLLELGLGEFTKKSPEACKKHAAILFYSL